MTPTGGWGYRQGWHSGSVRSAGSVARAPREDNWAPGYYSLLFEDPDGIRLEFNHVPGKGLLA